MVNAPQPPQEIKHFKLSQQICQEKYLTGFTVSRHNILRKHVCCISFFYEPQNRTALETF